MQVNDARSVPPTLAACGGAPPLLLTALGRIALASGTRARSSGLGIPAIAWRLTDEGVPTPKPGMRWHEPQVHRIIGNAAYKGTWSYGRRRTVTTEEGTKIYAQPKETWIEVAVPPLVDETTWNRTQQLKKQRLAVSKRNTKVTYLLQHLLRCRVRTTVQGEGHLGFK